MSEMEISESRRLPMRGFSVLGPNEPKPTRALKKGGAG